MAKTELKTKPRSHKLANSIGRKTVNEYIGSRISTYRKAKNIKQKTLGSLLHPPITQQQLSKYEGGRDSIPASVLFEIATILGMTTESFMPLDMKPAREKKLTKTLLDNALNKAIISFAKCANISQKEQDQLAKSLTQLYKSKQS